MNADSISSINRLSEALLTFYDTDEVRKRLLGQVEGLMEYLEREGEISLFLRDYGLDREDKKSVISELERGLGLDELLANGLSILVDGFLISGLGLFLSTTRSKLLQLLGIKNIYVYSSFPIREDQVKRLERLWRDRLNRECNFHYAIDGSLRLGIKVQVDMYIEEYSLNSSLKNLKIKLDSLLIY